MLGVEEGIRSRGRFIGAIVSSGLGGFPLLRLVPGSEDEAYQQNGGMKHDQDKPEQAAGEGHLAGPDLPSHLQEPGPALHVHAGFHYAQEPGAQ